MKKRTVLMLLIGLVILSVSFGAVQGAGAPVVKEMVINPKDGPESIEIYVSEAINLKGWTISNQKGTVVATLPDWPIPADCVLMVYLGAGTNDNDFSDKKGAFYTGTKGNFLNDTAEEIFFANGTPDTATVGVLFSSKK